MQKKWNLDLIWIEIGVFKNLKECARSPCNGNHFSSLELTTFPLFPRDMDSPEEGVHASYYSVIDLAPPTIGSVHFFQPISTVLVKGLATPRLLEIWLRGKVQAGISILRVLQPF